MGGNVDGPSNTQQKTESSTTNPWAPAIPVLGDIINKVRGLGTDPSEAQRAAAGGLLGAARGIPDFSGQVGDVAKRLLGGGAPNYSGMLFDALGNLKQNLAPYTDPGFLNPLTAPGIGGALRTIGNDVADRINGMFAGAGRDLSGAHVRALARGIGEAENPIVADLYKSNLNTATDAAKTLYGAAGTAAGGASGLNQAELANLSQGVGVLSQIPNFMQAPWLAQLNAANTQGNLDLDRLATMAKLVTPLAGLGGSRTGESTTTTQTQVPLWQAMLGGATDLGKAGAFGQSGWLTGSGGLGAQLGSGLSSAASGLGNLLGFGSGIGSSLFGSFGPIAMLASDARVKESIAPVGETYDGQRIYSYRLKGDPTPRIGLLAQEVERVAPEAVADVRGVKRVDYGKATERARALGMLHHLMPAM